MSEKSIKLAEQTLKSGYLGEGPRVKEFEEKLEQALGLKVRTVNSATSAIDLACHMVGLEKGDEVITTAQTCTASNSPPHNRGATLVWADVDPLTGLIDPKDVARKITDKTKLIIAVNWGGYMPDYAALKSHGIPVLEDAAHGPYKTDKERGDYIVWSFQAIKHLTCGDGGALYSPDYTRARLLSWYGLDRESSSDFRCNQNIQEIGYKYHMNDIAASIGLGNIEKLETLIAIHRGNAAWYEMHLTNSKIQKPVFDPECPYWLYTIQTDMRDELKVYLEENGIASSLVHARNDKHDGFTHTKYAYMLPGLASFDARQLSIPVGWWIDQSDIEYITEVINKW